MKHAQSGSPNLANEKKAEQGFSPDKGGCCTVCMIINTLFY